MNDWQRSCVAIWLLMFSAMLAVWLPMPDVGAHPDSLTRTSLCGRIATAGDWPAGVVEDVGSPQWLSNEDVAATSAYPTEALRQFAQLGRIERCERHYSVMRDGVSVATVSTWIVGYATPTGAEAGFQMAGPVPGSQALELPVPRIGDQAALYLTGDGTLLVYRDRDVVIGLKVVAWPELLNYAPAALSRPAGSRSLSTRAGTPTCCAGWIPWRPCVQSAAKGS